jgi:hypothetical protein
MQLDDSGSLNRGTGTTAIGGNCLHSSSRPGPARASPEPFAQRLAAREVWYRGQATPPFALERLVSGHCIRTLISGSG